MKVAIKQHPPSWPWITLPRIQRTTTWPSSQVLMTTRWRALMVSGLVRSSFRCKESSTPPSMKLKPSSTRLGGKMFFLTALMVCSSRQISRSLTLSRLLWTICRGTASSTLTTMMIATQELITTYTRFSKLWCRTLPLTQKMRTSTCLLQARPTWLRLSRRTSLQRRATTWILQRLYQTQSLLLWTRKERKLCLTQMLMIHHLELSHFLEFASLLRSESSSTCSLWEMTYSKILTIHSLKVTATSSHRPISSANRPGHKIKLIRHLVPSLWRRNSSGPFSACCSSLA